MTDFLAPLTATARPAEARLRALDRGMVAMSGGARPTWPRALTATLLDLGPPTLVSLLLSVAVARHLGAADFGRFSVALALFTVAHGVGRAAIVEPSIAVHGAAGGPLGRGAAHGLVRLMAQRVALPVSTLLGVASLLTGGVMQSSLLLFAVIAPIVGALETTRAAGLASRSAAAGAVWLASFAVVVGAGLGSRAGHDHYVLGVGAAAVLALAVSLSGLPAATEAPVDRDRLTRLDRPPGAELLMAGTAAHLLIVLVGVVTGFEAAAGLRGAIVVASPLVALITGLRSSVVADAARYGRHHRDDRWWSYVLRTTGAVAAAGAAGAVVIWALADTVGPPLLGDTWLHARGAIGPFVAATVVSSTHVVAEAVLLARLPSGRALRIRLALLPGSVVPSLVGAYAAGASGAAWGLLVGAALAAPAWILMACAPPQGRTMGSQRGLGPAPQLRRS